MLDIKDIEKIARDVYRTLGSGFSEDVYDKAMKVGLPSQVSNMKTKRLWS